MLQVCQGMRSRSGFHDLETSKEFFGWQTLQTRRRGETMKTPSRKTNKAIRLAGFQMPSVQTMVSRKSSITNAFVCSLVPVLPPSPQEIVEALSILGMKSDDVRCAYCGDKSSEWDHLRPLVLNLRPTGYISEIANLVPACGKCNQSKGNSSWREWMKNIRAKHSPTRREIADVETRMARLELYEQWRPPTKIDFQSIVGGEDWNEYWSLYDRLNEQMRQCQIVAESLRQRIVNSLAPKQF
jgi:5-methylcytosine-specific restriction endonuclease McrA